MRLMQLKTCYVGSVWVCCDSNYFLTLLSHDLVSASAITDGFDDVCGQTCECALSSFYDICHKISRRSVTKVELTLVEKNLQQIKKLCQAVSKDGHGNTKPNFDDVNDDLQERLKEMRCFELHRQRLEYFCSQVSSIQG